MFTLTSEKLGTVAGQIETPEVTAGREGLSMVVHGLSPVALSWTPKNEETEKPTDVPKTGDEAPLFLWVSLMLLGLAGLAILALTKTKKAR